MLKKLISSDELSTEIDSIDINWTDPMAVYGLTGQIMASMLNGSIEWSLGNAAREAIFKKAKEKQMAAWDL